MKSLYNKQGRRRGEGEGHSYAFFAVGAIVVLAAVFVIGLQVGRVIEKDAAAVPNARPGKASPAPANPETPPRAGAADIRKDLGAFSEEASKVPVIPPPIAVDEGEKKFTFPETLEKKEATVVPLVRAKKDVAPAREAQPAKSSGGRKYVVQAGAFRDKGAAEAQRKKLGKAGYSVRVVQAARKNRQPYFRVLLGPFSDGEAAKKAVRRLKNEMKIEAFLIQG
ncbi:MAG: SPOR domain-containing protein [Deltaproteobacteria bacterium]|nr:SPOR domain-containing protein [Candidatus Deferrimicrobiaceae bacterium]